MQCVVLNGIECWEAEPEKRPNFKNITNMLSCNNEKEKETVDEVQVFEKTLSDDSADAGPQSETNYEPVVRIYDAGPHTRA